MKKLLIALCLSIAAIGIAQDKLTERIYVRSDRGLAFNVAESENASVTLSAPSYARVYWQEGEPRSPWTGALVWSRHGVNPYAGYEFLRKDGLFRKDWLSVGLWTGGGLGNWEVPLFSGGLIFGLTDKATGITILVGPVVEIQQNKRPELGLMLGGRVVF